MLAVLAANARSATYSCPASIAYSTFIGISSSSSGGAIYLSATGCVLTTQFCIFANDTSSGSGGAIYISGSNFTCYSTCFSRCASSSTGLAIYFTTSSASISLTEVSQSCSKSSSSSMTLCFVGASLSYAQINMTLNNALFDISGIWAQCTSYRFGSFSSFNNNTDGSGATIDLQGSPTVSNFTFSNYVGNSPGSTYGFIWSDSGSQGTFVNCLFLSNGATTIAVIGSSSNPKYPIFCNCVFDVASTRLSGCTLYSCSFGVSFATQVPNSLLSSGKCHNMNQTSTYSNNAASARLNDLGFIEFTILMLLEL